METATLTLESRVCIDRSAEDPSITGTFRLSNVTKLREHMCAESERNVVRRIREWVRAEIADFSHLNFKTIAWIHFHFVWLPLGFVWSWRTSRVGLNCKNWRNLHWTPNKSHELHNEIKIDFSKFVWSSLVLDSDSEVRNPLLGFRILNPPQPPTQRACRVWVRSKHQRIHGWAPEQNNPFLTRAVGKSGALSS